jgi:hypothetical protein
MLLQKTAMKTRLFWIALSILLIAPVFASNFFNDDYFFSSPLSTVEAPFGYYNFLSSKDPVNWP